MCVTGMMQVMQKNGSPFEICHAERPAIREHDFKNFPSWFAVPYWLHRDGNFISDLKGLLAPTFFDHVGRVVRCPPFPKSLRLLSRRTIDRLPTVFFAGDIAIIFIVLFNLRWDAHHFRNVVIGGLQLHRELHGYPRLRVHLGIVNRYR